MFGPVRGIRPVRLLKNSDQFCTMFGVQTFAGQTVWPVRFCSNCLDGPLFANLRNSPVFCSEFHSLKHKKSQKDTKVILTVRDSDEQWWKSWCGFMTQEYTRFTIGDFCVGGLLNVFAKKGYFGPKMTTIMEVGKFERSHSGGWLLLSWFLKKCRENSGSRLKW